MTHSDTYNYTAASSVPPCFIHFKAMDMLGSASSLVHAGLGAGPAATSPLCTAAAAAADLSAVTGSLDTPNATGSHTNRSGHKKNPNSFFFSVSFSSHLFLTVVVVVSWQFRTLRESRKAFQIFKS